MRKDNHSLTIFIFGKLYGFMHMLIGGNKNSVTSHHLQVMA